MKLKLIISIFAIILNIVTTKAQNVNIPDANFKAYLLANKAINSNGDNEIQVSEASNYKDSIVVPKMKISDLTGIEAFDNLSILICSGNKLTNLNLTKSTKLKKLECMRNQLEQLDIQTTPNLNELICSNNLLTILDVSINNSLNKLNCDFNYLTILDVSKNINLKILYCDYNELTNLNLSQNTSLIYLSCSKNKLLNLDVSSNTSLIYLSCSKNKLINLDVSYNTALTALGCDDNELVSLNLQNHNNKKLDIFTNEFNPYLKCIQVDDVVFMNKKFPNATNENANYSKNCKNKSKK